MERCRPADADRQWVGTASTPTFGSAAARRPDRRRRLGLASPPVTAGVLNAAGAASQLMPRIGANPLTRAGSTLATVLLFKARKETSRRARPSTWADPAHAPGVAVYDDQYRIG